MTTCFTCELLLIILFWFILFWSIAPHMGDFTFFGSK
jgi:hypothetical protein